MSVASGFFGLLHEPLLVLDGGGIIRQANGCLVRLLHYAGERELVGKRAAALFADRGRSLPPTDLQHLLDGTGLAGLGSMFSVEAIRRDRSRIPVDVKIFRWSDTPSPMLVALVRQPFGTKPSGGPGSAALSANAELACVGHELANLLTPVLGYLELWKLDGNPPLPNEQMADALLNVGRRMQIHVQNLQMLRQRAARTVRPTDLAATVRRAIDTLQETGIANQHRIEFHDDSDGQGKILAEGDVLEHAIVNLLLNAAEAMAQPGTIEVSIGVTNGVAELRITDQGPGIADENRRRVFDPFFSTKRNGKGIGLGLYVVSLIAERMDGTIRIDAHAPKGATAVLSLPLYPTIGH